jgi:hypothetical protein
VAEEVGASVGEALGVGGRGTRRQGGVGQRRQGRWQERRCEGEVGVLAGGGAARGVAGSSAHRRGRCGVEEVGARCRAGRGLAVRGWDAWDKESWGRSGGVRSDGWRGRSRRARGVGQLGAWGLIGRLDRWVQVMDL